MKRLILFKERNKGSGGKEIYVSRLSSALSEANITHDLKHSIFPLFLPSWLRQILFDIQICFAKKDRILFSFERIKCPDIYRAGDGVHKEFLKLQKKSILNPLHYVMSRFEKKCFLNSKIIIANSNLVREQIISNYRIDKDKIKVIYNGIKLEHSRNSLSKVFLKKFSIKNKLIFLFVGNGFERKGLESFLKILSRLDTLNFVAFVVGKDKRENKYIELARSLGVGQKVFFMGKRDDVQSFYKIADFFILPTKYDPFSNVVLEAMFSKNIVITTRQNGASEILDQDLVMKSSEDFEVIKMIQKIAASDELMHQFKLKNYQISKTYSIEENMKRTINVIDAL